MNIMNRTLKTYLLLVVMITNAIANRSLKMLDDRMVQSNSLVCVGLDPDVTKMPLQFINANATKEENIFSFLKDIINITAPHCCCFKLQKAFYDQLDLGHELLRNTVKYIHDNHPGIPVYLDCKIGDIDNTMKAYISLIFDDIQADGVVINPYMGEDVLQPFLQDSNKTGIILIQTSNPNAKMIQDLTLANGKRLWEEILDFTLKKWNENNNLIVVLSSNSEDYDYSPIRSRIPQNTPILLAGIGSQGGNPKIMKQLLNTNNRGVFVNSSRGILYPYDPADINWRSSVLEAVLDLKNLLNNIRG